MRKIQRTEKLRGKKNKKIFFIIFSVFLSFFFFGILWDHILSEREALPSHITFYGEDLSGMSYEEAKRIIFARVREESEKTVVLFQREKLFPFSRGELGFPLDGTMLYQQAISLGKEDSFVKRVSTRRELFFHGVALEDLIEIDGSKLNLALAGLEDQLDVTAKNASFAFDEKGDISIVPSKRGSFLNRKATADHLRSALADSGKRRVALVIAEDSDPSVTTADLNAMRINGILGTFTTYYSEADADRAHNISLAASRIDRALVMPGEIFSFNEVVGPRSYERGFRDAPIIENGEYTDGLGGGVCQVSTTVYGAILRTELAVKERRAHSLVSSYVEPGQDAMVAWGTSDLCFQNTYKTPILLHTLCSGGALTVSIYGDMREKAEVTVTSEILGYLPYRTERVIDPDLPSGSSYIRSSGKRGLECTVYRTVKKNGTEIRKETVSHDIYMAQKRIIVSSP